MYSMVDLVSLLVGNFDIDWQDTVVFLPSTPLKYSSIAYIRMKIRQSSIHPKPPVLHMYNFKSELVQNIDLKPI